MLLQELLPFDGVMEKVVMREGEINGTKVHFTHSLRIPLASEWFLLLRSGLGSLSQTKRPDFLWLIFQNERMISFLSNSFTSRQQFLTIMT